MNRSSLVYAATFFALAVSVGGCKIVVDEGVCGDGFRDPGEGCDDGNNRNGDGCSASCAVETSCGDGVRDTGEGCDDGNLISGDGCSASCMVESTCGNGRIDTGEGCDDGNNRNGDGCSSTCMVEVRCGNGVLETGEECDDGNNRDGDGCSSTCTIESTGYLICDVAGDCNGRDMCLEVTLTVPAPGTKGAMCSHTCGMDSECMAANTFTGACLSVEGTTAICYQRCDMDSDCFTPGQNVCISVTVDGILDGICVPNNTGM